MRLYNALGCTLVALCLTGSYISFASVMKLSKITELQSVPMVDPCRLKDVVVAMCNGGLLT